MKSKFLVSLLVLLMFFILPVANVSAKSKEENTMQKYSKILSSSVDYSDFEDEYGGVFINEDGMLVLNIVKGKKNKFIGNVYYDEDIIINEVDYSLKDINNEIKELTKVSKDFNIIAIERSEKDNTLIVTISEDFNKKEKTLKTFSKLKNIIVVEKNDNVELVPTVKYTINGESTTIGSSGLTVGFAAKNSSGDPGFVTAGHITASNGTNVYYDGSHCGDVDGSPVFSGDVDATFVELRDPWIGHTWLPTKDFMNGDSYYSVNTADMYIVQGAGVKTYGALSGRESGTILSTSMSFEIDGVWHTDFVKSDYIAIHGDSGAAVTMPGYWGASTFHVKVIGLQSSSYLDSITGEWIDGVSYSLFGKSGNLFDELDLSGY